MFFILAVLCWRIISMWLFTLMSLKPNAGLSYSLYGHKGNASYFCHTTPLSLTSALVPRHALSQPMPPPVSLIFRSLALSQGWHLQQFMHYSFKFWVHVRKNPFSWLKKMIYAIIISFQFKHHIFPEPFFSARVGYLFPHQLHFWGSLLSLLKWLLFILFRL